MKFFLVKRLLAIVLAIVLISIPIVNAQGNDMGDGELISDFQLHTENPDDLHILISGRAHSYFTVYVWDENNFGNRFSSESVPIALAQIDLPLGYSYYENIKIKLKSDIATGNYFMTVTDKDGLKKTIFFKYISNAQSKEAFDKINEAIPQGQQVIYDEFSIVYPTLHIGEEEFQTYGHFVSSILANRKNFNGEHIKISGISDFQSLYDESIKIYDYLSRSDDDSAEDILKNNAKQLGINYEKYFTSLPVHAKEELISLLDNSDGYLYEAYSSHFAKMSALAAIRSVEKWQDIKEIITKSHSDVLSIDLTNIEKRDEIFNEMSNEKYSYTVFEDILQNFSLAKDTVEYRNTKPTQNPGSNRGSGGGGGMYVSSLDDLPELSANNSADNIRSFPDLPSEHWAKKEIDFLVSKNAISGYPDGEFKPQNYITRAEFIKILVCSFELTGNSVLPFNDIPDDSWYKEYVQIAYGLGLIFGTPENKFLASKEITRQDACTIVYRLLASCLVEDDSDTAVFNDYSDISDYAKKAISVLSNCGIVRGFENNCFVPHDLIDRQSAAVLIYNSLQYEYR